MHIVGISQTYTRHSSTISQAYLRYIIGKNQVNRRHISGKFLIYLMHISVIYQADLIRISGIAHKSLLNLMQISGRSLASMSQISEMSFEIIFYASSSTSYLFINKRGRYTLDLDLSLQLCLFRCLSKGSAAVKIFAIQKCLNSIRGKYSIFGAVALCKTKIDFQTTSKKKMTPNIKTT